ncbi:MAG: neutral/alkaline non-lysosomal ceramidase N-terminal domain-containing protein [Limnochordia bacterium]|jgi:neutral ceramidase
MSEDAYALNVGYAQVTITPEVALPMAGYASRGKRPFETVEDPLTARAIFLEQGKARAVLLVADLVGIDESWGHRLRTGVGEQLSMPAENVVLFGTHTHFGPAVRAREMAGKEHEVWVQEAVRAMEEAAVAAAQKTRRSFLRVGTADVGEMMFNRRLRRPDGTCCTVYRLPLPEADLEFRPVDPKLTVLRFDDTQGEPVLLMASVGIHPVVGGGNFYGISADYPGALRQAVEAVYQVPCVFALGTAGNVVPLQRGEGQRARLGRYLAGAVCQAAETARLSPVCLNVVHECLDLPAADDSRIPFEITTLHLGDLGVVALPGEIFVETGLMLQQRSPFPKTLVLSMANQLTGYLPTRTAFWEGGYEASVTRMSERSESLVVDQANHLLIQLWEAGLKREKGKEASGFL